MSFQETSPGQWFNFHTHSHYCDGKGSLSEYIDHAKKIGMTALGFSSHAPVPFDCNWCMKEGRLQEYLTEIESLKNTTVGIEIYKSLEIDFIPGMISPSDFKDRLDYTVGSIHFVDQLPKGKPWEIDGPHQPFLEGLASVFGNDMRAAVTRYFELTREMVSQAMPTIIGHLDKIKIQNKENKFFRESDTWYQREVIKTLDLIRETGGIVEVNTRGIYQKKSETTYPSPWILGLIVQKEIPVTISSDAHHPSDLTNQFSATAALLKKIGVSKINALHKGVWEQFDYEQDGITPVQ